VTEECDDGNVDDLADGCTTSCRVRDLPVVPLAVADPVGGRRLGGSRHPVAAGTAGFAVALLEGLDSPALSLAMFDAQGVPAGIIGPLTGGGLSFASAHPTVAALQSQYYALAWAGLGLDGDDLGIGLQLIDAGTAQSGPIQVANATTGFSQRDPDMVWTGSELVVAWIDDASFGTAPDIKVRTFNADLTPASPEQTLAATSEVESSVAVAPFNGGWAAAWRASAPGALETIEVRVGAIVWSVEPFLPAPADDRPVLAELDATHLLVVFTASDDLSGASALRCAVLDIGNPGVVEAHTINASAPSATVAQSHPAAVHVQGRTYVAWRSDSLLADPNAEDLWLKRIEWPAGTVGVMLADPEIPLVRQAEHALGDQRLPALAASPLGPEGALVLVWEDFGGVFGFDEASPDVVLELAPSPIVRLPVGP
jgi:hypothetical protein